MKSTRGLRLSQDTTNPWARRKWTSPGFFSCNEPTHGHAKFFVSSLTKIFAEKNKPDKERERERQRERKRERYTERERDERDEREEEVAS